jgi:ABC-type iron transport system FetAB ATPase subunit
MFLLVTGASGAGKSTARLAVASVLSPDVECVELHDVIDVPAFPTLAHRAFRGEAHVMLPAEGL